jgi:integrase
VGLWKDPGTGLWKYQFQHQGKLYGGGGYSTKGEARTAREDRRKLVLAGAERPRPETPTIHMEFLRLVALYLQQSERRHAVKTFKYKRFVYAMFLRHCGDEKITIDKITPYLIQDYLQTRGSNDNANRHLKDLAVIFEYARKVLGVIQVNPCSVIERLPVVRAPKKIPTKEEFLKLLSATKDNERPLVLVLAYTAARIGEVLRLKWEDVNFQHNFIQLWTKKNRDGEYRARRIPMKDYMKSMMLGLWEERVQDVWVFFNKRTDNRFVRPDGFMHSLCKRAGIPNYGFHSIRHFVCSYLLDQEKLGTPTVSRLLGHQKLSTTDIYAHSLNIQSQDDALGMAVERLEASFVPKLIPATSSGSNQNTPKTDEERSR